MCLVSYNVAVQMPVCFVFVCLSTGLLKTRGMIWIPYDWLNKFYSCHVATVLGTVNGCDLGIGTHHEN